MITMFVQMGVKPEGSTEADFIENQTYIMNVLLAAAGIVVPLMLLVPPVMYNAAAKKKHARVHSGNYVRAENPFVQDIKEMSNDVISVEDDNHGFGEFFVHSMIETIEYSLGTISNTASYLRLWALSLAHGQLAKVFLDFTVGKGFESGDYITLFFGYYIFIGVTFGVLMIMDLLECFLHTLRLHWVEFQNKFYKGAGYLMRPYEFESCLNLQDE